MATVARGPARAGALSRPRWVERARMTRGSSMMPTRRIGPAHRGHSSTSSAKVRRSSVAQQRRRARVGSLGGGTLHSAANTGRSARVGLHSSGWARFGRASCAPSSPPFPARSARRCRRVAHQMNPRRWDERAQSQQQRFSGEAQHLSTVGEATLHPIGVAPVFLRIETPEGQRRPQSISAQTFEPLAVVRTQPGGSV